MSAFICRLGNPRRQRDNPSFPPSLSLRMYCICTHAKLFMLFAHHPQSRSIFLVLGRGEKTIISRVVAIPTASRELLSTRPNIRLMLRECNVISPLFCSQGDITGSNHGNQPCFVHIGCQQNPVGTRCACNMIDTLILGDPFAKVLPFSQSILIPVRTDHQISSLS